MGLAINLGQIAYASLECFQAGFVSKTALICQKKVALSYRTGPFLSLYKRNTDEI